MYDDYIIIILDLFSNNIYLRQRQRRQEEEAEAEDQNEEYVVAVAVATITTLLCANHRSFFSSSPCIVVISISVTFNPETFIITIIVIIIVSIAIN